MLYLIGDFLPVEIGGITVDGRKIAGRGPDHGFGKNKFDIGKHAEFKPDEGHARAEEKADEPINPPRYYI